MLLFLMTLGIFVKFSSATCTWPSNLANTNWRDNSKGDISFTTDKLTGWGISVTQANPALNFSTWKCHSNGLYSSDNIIIAVTESAFTLYGTVYYGYICLKMTAVTDYSYRYYVYSPVNTGIGSERVNVRTTKNETDLQTLCLLNSPAVRPGTTEYRVIIKSGSFSSAKIDCPYLFLGSYNYEHTDSNGVLTCDTSSDTWSTCQDSTEMRFDYATCTTKVANSKSNTVWCVDSVPSGGDNYVSVYNGNDADADIDNVYIYRFSCFAISADGTTATVMPNQCRSGQSPTSTPTGGSYLRMTRYASVSCPTCPILQAPNSGSVTFSTNGATTTASYSCSSQYSLAGPSTRACQSNDTWADENPTCTCILPSAPANGSLEALTNGTLVYSCNVGFVLNGSRTRQCQTNSNTWSGTQPTCDPCASISNTSGLLVSKSSTGVTTVANFTCSAGYTLDGATSATCLVSKLWDASAPACVMCANLSASSSLKATLSTDGYTSSATFTCVTGYHLVGSSSATCSKLGVWSSVPTCECDAPAAPGNGTRTGNGSVSYFSCNEGFNLQGSAYSTCKTDGTGWSSSTPNCTACSNLASPIGGYYNLTTTGTVSIATFSCQTGYTMSGSRTRYCQANGSWNGTTPSCVKCPDLASPSSGTVSVSTDGVTSQAHYACANKYNISGSSDSICKTDGTWTNSAPTCYCSPASKPLNGDILSDNGVFVYYKCNLNYSMSGSSVRSCTTNGTGWSGTDPVCVLCVPLHDVSGGSVALSTDDVNTKAAYSCDVGYTISGNKEITCLSTGAWDSAQANCTMCDALTSPTRGNYTQQSVDNTVTKATFTCDVGSTLKGYSELMCKDTGAWDNSAPECVQCPSRTQPSSGNFTMQTDGQTTTGKYYCASGYSLAGQSLVTCRTTGFWSLPDATCECITPAAPANGTVTANGKTITFTCNTGFTLSGSSSGSCNTNGTGWSISTPQCVTCETLSNFTGGNVTYASDGITTTAHYTCPAGASLQGTSTATCNSTGHWQAAVPKCVSCPTLPGVSVSTGNINVITDGTTTTAHYSCPSGYEVKGDTTLTCTTSGTWSNNASDCVCETPTAPAGGNFTVSEDGLSVVFACGEGYTMDGTQTVGCATDGSGWNITYPTCTKCDNLTTPSNGNVMLVTSGTQTTALFTCGLGYTLSGTSSPTCQPDGTWSTSVASQTCVSCPSLPSVTVPNGSVVLATNGTTTTAVYSCPDGYEVKGNETLMCGADGSWDSSPSTCVCEKPKLPSGGNYTLSDDGLTVTFSCDAGYTIKGGQQISCATDGSGWTLTFPNCTQCGSLTMPARGDVSLVTNGTQTTAVYSCDVGSSLDGVATPTCQDDGTWTSSQPTCVSCPTLPSVTVTTGHVDLVTDGTTTTAVYVCPTGYEVKGAQNITCGTDGAWSSQPSDCVCKSPTSLDGGNFTLSSDGLTVTFTCGAGYTMIGTQTIPCATDGSGWSISQPNCTKCENVSSPSGGAVTLTTTGTQTTALYTCGVGYSLDGQSTPQCQTDGTWTADEPTCVGCPTAVNISNGQLNVSTNGQTTQAHYTCSTGYVMDGNPTLTCLTSGQWDGSPPECYCAVPSAPLFGSVVANKTAAVYSCSQGYILKGTAIRTCQGNGQGWTDSAPSCITCDTLTAPSDGLVLFTSNGTVTMATYSCDSGFTMAGTQILICLVNGSWSGQPPTCVKCPDLIQPNSGNVAISTNSTLTSATYTCVSGYHVVGTAILTCSSYGNWSHNVPFCACDNVTAPANGDVKISVALGVAKYTCDLGYSINGVATRLCAIDGSGWSDSQPSCVGCPSLTSTSDGNSTVVSNGTVTSVNFQCDLGASLDGPSTVTCKSDGTWSISTQPTCVTCPSLTNPSSGTVNLTTNGQTSTVAYTCASVYQVVGTSSRQCQTDGTWSGSGGNTTCVCTAPPSPSNGTLTLLDNGMTAEYTCNLYFTLSGDSERTCQTDGSGWTGNNPSCVVYTHPTPPTNGNVTISTNGTHTVATFTCELGATLKGASVLVWLPDGKWSATVPSCVTCPSLSSPSSGSMALSTNGITTTATFTCATDYHISGATVLTCKDNAKWSDSSPQCLCDDPSTIANGQMSSNGKTATFRCDVGYSLSGTSTLSCNSYGTGWDNTVPMCVQCTTLTTPSSGSLTQSTDGLVTMATFQCNLGTTLNGSSTLKCNPNGSWNSSEPKCVTCGSYSSPANGQYEMTTDGLTSSIELQCNEGYEVSGLSSVQCGADGQWTFTQASTCEKVQECQDSLLGVLIGVTVTSLVIITILAILLARFVYLYLKKNRRGKEYLSILDTNGSFGKTKGDYYPFAAPMTRMTSSIAPVNHQRHVMEGDLPFATGSAPQAFEKHVTGNGEVPLSPPPVETYRSEKSIISFRRSATNMTGSSVQSLSAVKIRDTQENGPQHFTNKTNKHSKTTGIPSPDSKANRLSPIPNHQLRLGKLAQSPQIKRLQVEDGGRRSPDHHVATPSSRSSTPIQSHSLSVSDYDSKSLNSVSMIDN